MDSGPVPAATPDDGVGDSRRWTDCKVYTRRNRAKKNTPSAVQDPQPSSRETLAENPQPSPVGTLDENPQPSSRENLATTNTKDDLQSSLHQPPAEEPPSGHQPPAAEPPSGHQPPSVEPPSGHQPLVSLHPLSDNEPFSLNRPCPEGTTVHDFKDSAPHENGSLENGRDEPSQLELLKIRQKLLADLAQVRDLFKRLEARQIELFAVHVDGDGGAPSQFSANHGNTTMSGKRAPALAEAAVSVDPPAAHSHLDIPVPPNFSGKNSIANSMLVDEIFSDPAAGGARSQLSVNHATTPVAIQRAPVVFDALPNSPAPLPFRPRLSIIVPHGAGTRNNISELPLQKEKRTPKANQYFHSSDFILGKDKIPPPPSLKKSKTSKSKKNFSESDYKTSPEKKVYTSAFKSCRALLEKLMKHKFGWVFNKPVDVDGLGLYDYFLIIKHPMDLGTVKSRLADNFYETPEEFAEDVRLTFRNAMTYNPDGQDVHFMAQEMSNIFEERWLVIETEFTDQLHHLYSVDKKRAPLRGTIERSDSTVHPIVVDLRKEQNQYHHFDRPIALKKPKAKDLYKREMTLKEKQTLSRQLENLPPEKLDLVVEIIKKRNFALSQHDDEIEVDIDSVDTDTLWELDRFVSNYKKTLSKHKRKAELAMLARAETEHLSQERMNGDGPDPVASSAQQNDEAMQDQNDVAAHLVVAGVNNGNDATGSSSSSGSSSDSSSDSDSDSGSSSSYESDAPH